MNAKRTNDYWHSPLKMCLIRLLYIGYFYWKITQVTNDLNLQGQDSSFLTDCALPKPRLNT